ncbi:MAG TPA: dienelactone hydrolase family protein [Amycolatopsis sp.]|uniref:dienelactone hydrolase family protein n=1 Tax=Amycolatopsis sp. TaxID=37632 RepID=UPI002B471F74|nr:dienelactone hydrolase family protein [Amycolatopsis sp.]HKS46854.1 dienelactone hydrolase family protein [Amycolatopsis sp.]
MTIETRDITVEGQPAYLAHPDGGSTAGMLLIPMITGIGAQVREFADAIAATGVTVLSWDPWQGRGSSDDTPPETLSRWMGELDDKAAISQQQQLLDYLFGELGCTKAGAIGWCLGGRFALILGGQDHRLANVVAFHPTVPGTPMPNHVIDAVEETAKIQAPVMMLYPGADDLVPVESFNRLQTALQSRASGPSIVHVYPDAEHGFSAKHRHANPVNAEAFAISWPQVLEFVKVTTGA